MRGIENIPWLYDWMLALNEALGLGKWRRWLVGGARGRTLDIGCGTGRNFPLYGSEASVVGLDPDRWALRRARRRGPGTALVRGSAEHLPFRDGAFDTVVSGLVFCSGPNPKKGLAEVRRVLCPGGELRMLEHVRATEPRAARIQDFVQPLWTRITGGCHPNRDTESSVESAGFDIQAEGRRAKKNMRRFAARPT